MTLLGDLASGKHGLVVTPPVHLAATEQTDTRVDFADREHGVEWSLSFFPGAHLDLAPVHLLHHHGAIQHHARQLFASCATDFEAVRQRMTNAGWSPVVEMDRTSMNGGAALTVLHRTHQSATRESVMGHTLVPVAGGLFEARWSSTTHPGGVRESALRIKLQAQHRNLLDVPQWEYDDAAHDARFPTDPLTLARAAKRWHDGRLKVEQGPSIPTDDDVALAAIGCAVRPPARFRLQGTTVTKREASCGFLRIAFSGTYGVDRLVVTRMDEKIRGRDVARRLVKLAREEAGLAEVHEVRALEGDSPVAFVRTSDDAFEQRGVRVRTVSRWFLDETGRIWSISLATTFATSLAELALDLTGELDAVARSWYRLRSEPHLPVARLLPR